MSEHTERIGCMNTDSKTYRITLDGKQYTGTAGEVARWYCQQKKIELYVRPDGEEGTITLYARMPGVALPKAIAVFRHDLPYIDVWYEAFFTEHMQQASDLDCVAVDSPQLERSRNELMDEVVEYMDRLHPERDACLEAAARIACEAMRMETTMVDEVDHYIRIVMKVMRMAYPKLLELRCEEWD